MHLRDSQCPEPDDGPCWMGRKDGTRVDMCVSLAPHLGTKDPISIKIRSQNTPKLTSEKQVPLPQKATLLAGWNHTSPMWGLWM